MQGNDFPQGFPGGQMNDGPQINVLEYPTITCSKCGHDIFVPGVIFKKVSGLALGMGSNDVTVPIKVAICAKCGTLSPPDHERLIDDDEEQKKAEEKKPNGGLIL